MSLFLVDEVIRVYRRRWGTRMEQGHNPRLLLTEKLQAFSANLPREALALYPSSAPCPTADRCPERAYTTMGSDIRATCPSNELARGAAGKSATRRQLGTVWVLSDRLTNGA